MLGFADETALKLCQLDFVKTILKSPRNDAVSPARNLFAPNADSAAGTIISAASVAIAGFRCALASIHSFARLWKH